MREFDENGLFLAKLQAEVFGLSTNFSNCGSLTFIRRYIYSDFCLSLDKLSALNEIITPKEIIENINAQYPNPYGSKTVDYDCMYWLGYIYRYYSYTKQLTSIQVYKIIKPVELLKTYLPFHTQDPKKVIQQIEEMKGINSNINDNINKLIRKRIQDKIKKSNIII